MADDQLHKRFGSKMYSLSLATCLKVCVLCFMFSIGQCLNTETACIEVKKAYKDKGLNENDVPISAISGAELAVCPRGETCCTKKMEEQLSELSRKEHSKTLDDKMTLLWKLLSTRTKKFDGFFQDLINKSKERLNDMFISSYGLSYKQHAVIFENLYKELMAYYKGRNINLMEMLDTFFSLVFRKMFELMNVSNDYDEDYLNCVAERMDELQPFGDIPAMLSVKVKQSFVAARTFVQGMAIGRDVVSTVMGLSASDACIKGIVRMVYCPACGGLLSTKPCSNFCLNTMKGCLAYHAELNDAWNNYIDALNKVASKLDGPYNMEMLMQPLGVKISDAIMHAQESLPEITPKITETCGQPRYNRRGKREAKADPEGKRQDYSFPLPRRHLDNDRPGYNMDKLVRDIKKKANNAKDFWKNLPYSVCNNDKLVATPDQDDDCWNGQHRAKYTREVLKDGVLQQINNQEVEVDVSVVNMVINRQKIQLELMTNKLENAYRGEDVEWMDTEIDQVVASGSGDFIEQSGSGWDPDYDGDDRDDGGISFDTDPPPYNTGDNTGHRGKGHKGHHSRKNQHGNSHRGDRIRNRNQPQRPGNNNKNNNNRNEETGRNRQNPRSTAHFTSIYSTGVLSFCSFFSIILLRLLF